MSDIFVSYASEDRERILPLVRALETTGWSIFWDRTIPAGKTWRQVIGREIESCRCLVVAWTRTSVGKDWVHEEADVGKRRGILIPVLLDAVEPPFGFGSIQAANLVDWDGGQSSTPFLGLLADLGQVLGPIPSQADGTSRLFGDGPDHPESEDGARPPRRPAQPSGADDISSTAAPVTRQVSPSSRSASGAKGREPALPARRSRTTSGSPLYILVGSAAVVLFLGLAIVLWPIGERGGEAPMPAPEPPQPAERKPEPPPQEIEARSQEQIEPSPLEKATSQLEVKLDELLALAETAEKAQRFTTPANDNAVSYYREMLRLDPENATAIEGLRRIVVQYIEWAEQSLARGRLDRAEQNIQKAASVEPDHPSLAELSRELEARRAAQRRAQTDRPNRTPELTHRLPESAPAEPADPGPSEPGEVFRDALRDGGEGPEMVVVPAGQFRMGDIQGTGNKDERPVHRVTLKQPFAIGRYETTFEDYDRFAEATDGPQPSDEGWGRGARPVIHVSWDDAVAYAKWLSEQTGQRYRLPTESEWEYAARAGTETAFWWGNNARAGVANCKGCGGRWDGRQTAPAGQFRANAFGLFDTAGNVWEWVHDCWNGSYDGAPPDGSAREVAGCDRRVVRGGAWNLEAKDLRSSYRGGYGSDSRYFDFGFRLVRELD